MRVALGVEYDGSGFCGWQRQPAARSVQRCLEQALSRVADHPVGLVCAGRTDAGVHATGQVVHFDTQAHRASHNWVLGANSKLPPDIRIRWAQAVPEDFHARFSARARRYTYVFLCAPVPSALYRQRVAWSRVALDSDLMHRAGRSLIGEHDFSSFRAAGCQARHPRRRIHAVEVGGRDNLVVIEVTANAFLHHMVRNIAGMLRVVGLGDQPPEWAARILAVRDRTLAPPTAPPQGLYLTQVSYPTAFDLPTPPWVPPLL